MEQVYPTAEVLPENLLRFYIYFSEPMAREWIWKSVVLLDASGAVVPGAFIENKFDLWSPDDRRLTVLFDPGRVKTGLVAHNTLGRALEAGESYTLRVDVGAEARSGCAMSRAYSKTFGVVEADFAVPDLADWQIFAPSAGSKDTLRVVLDGPTDHLSLAYRIRVKDAQGNLVRGALRLGDEEREWLFTPTAPWAGTAYHLEVNTTLEDIAGNRLTGLFDRPLVTDGFSEPSGAVETLSFTPRPN
ncbi:hypothetical protein SAMN04488037_1133 [Shimia marina]|uniref:SbsA Ig-like domain-containing protein n=1 Tax=Shimia marina TaxID=321267 RepID=A0A0P1EQB5_9RHOB|nr:hypothetical protein SHM7688_01511 [Shimia marina]SFE63170.1 hypothetical protein SAMN04488037_1133 [Shimia marina]